MPIVLGHLFETDILSDAIDSGFHITSFAAITISHADLILTTLGQILQLMAQRTIGTGLCLNKA